MLQNSFNRHSILDILLPCIFVVSILSMQLFHWNTHKTVWKDFRVLFLPFSQDVPLVMDLLENSGVGGAISALSVDEKFFQTNCPPIHASHEQYLQWFQNENDALSYIYIPKASHISLQALKGLHDRSIHFYLEGNYYPTLVNSGSVILLLITFLCFSARKLIFFFSTLPYLLLSLLSPSLAILASILIFCTATFYTIEILFPSSNLDDEQKMERIRANITFFALFALAIILSLFDTLTFCMYTMLSFVASLCPLYIVGKLQYLSEQEKEATRSHAKPTLYILHPDFSQKLISSKKMIFSSFLLFFCYSLPIIFSNFYLLPLSESYGNTLALPSPSDTLCCKDFSLDSFDVIRKNKTEEMLPCLINYICDKHAHSTTNSANKRQNMSADDSSFALNAQNDDRVNPITDEFIRTTLATIKPCTIEAMLMGEKGFVSAFYDFRFFQIERLQLPQLAVSLLSMFASLAIMLPKR